MSRMESKSLQCFWFYLLLVEFVLPSCCSVSVQFLSQMPMYVVIGQNLVLKAEIEVPSGHLVTKVWWEHETQDKRNLEKTVVAEFPTKVPNSRVSLENKGAVLKLWNYQRADGGVYTVTVQDQQGVQSSAQCIVDDYEEVSHVSVMVNISHSSLHCTEAWGSEPVFTWLHEKAAVTQDVGRVSADGKSLYLNAKLCGHFTCMVSNRLGHSSDTYTAEPCPRDSNGAAVAVVCLLLLLILTAGLIFLLWRRCRSYSHRRERLQDSYYITT